MSFQLSGLHPFVRVVLQHWHGLQSAISRGMGGSPNDTNMKICVMIEELTKYCSQSGVRKKEVEELLLEFTNEYFDTTFEDGSHIKVAELLWGHIREWVQLFNAKPICEYMEKMGNIVPANPITDQELETDEESKEEISPDDDDNVMDTTDGTKEDDDGWEIPKYLQKKKGIK